MRVEERVAIHATETTRRRSNSKFEGLPRPMVDAARITDVLNPEHRAVRLIHPTKLQVM